MNANAYLFRGSRTPMFPDITVLRNGIRSDVFAADVRRSTHVHGRIVSENRATNVRGGNVAKNIKRRERMFVTPAWYFRFDVL